MIYSDYLSASLMKLNAINSINNAYYTKQFDFFSLDFVRISVSNKYTIDELKGTPTNIKSPPTNKQWIEQNNCMKLHGIFGFDYYTCDGSCLCACVLCLYSCSINKISSTVLRVFFYEKSVFKIQLKISRCNY